jgi:hypothetical protein
VKKSVPPSRASIQENVRFKISENQTENNTNSTMRPSIINGLQNQKWKMSLAEKNNPFPKDLCLGKNVLFLNYLRECKEQQEFLYYWIDISGGIRCHCFGHPPAAWHPEKGWYKCTKKNKKEGKCSLFIPARALESNN